MDPHAIRTCIEYPISVCIIFSSFAITTTHITPVPLFGWKKGKQPRTLCAEVRFPTNGDVQRNFSWPRQEIAMPHTKKIADRLITPIDGKRAAMTKRITSQSSHSLCDCTSQHLVSKSAHSHPRFRKSVAFEVCQTKRKHCQRTFEINPGGSRDASLDEIMLSQPFRSKQSC
ncbi:unnamed protein product [Periconia digitata]|uniref:Uncharacterized protein n=1 Tax=Periconia digitata TaxID=1303443 RepID=A0A9W4UAJ9_9PLEO|nr:unnamed protein product [Periconia digitata]